jgi:hypothetical protein
MIEVKESELYWSSRLIAILTVTSLTGFITYFWPGFGVWQQWTYLSHTLLGVTLSLLIAIYLSIHFKRTIGLKRPIPTIAGIFSALTAAVLIGTGGHLIGSGQSEAGRSVYLLHTTTAWLVVLLLALHIVLVRKRGDKASSHHSWPASRRLSVRYASVTLAGVSLATVVYTLAPNPYHDAAAITPYRLNYGEHPFRPSQTETASGTFIDSRRVGDSGRCGACHEEVTRQWQASIHAQAASDKTYQTNVNLLAKKKGMSTTRYCEGCHAPAALLSGQLSEGGKLDTVGHMQEGVSCLTCHGIDRVIHTKGVASYQFNPPSAYLFEGYDAWLPTKMHNFILRIQPRQHRLDMARSPLHTPELCATCHVQFMDKEVNNWGWVQMQDEYTAWLESPYSRQTKHSLSAPNLQRCQDCHFPLVDGRDPSANSNGQIHSHRALGGNTAIPWFTGNQEQLKQTENFLRADKVRISLDIPDRADAVRSNQHVEPKAAENLEPPDFLYLGETLKLNVIVSNAQVGHNFPGGTTDLNEVWLQIKAIDGQNRKVFESGQIGPDGEVDPSAYFYKSIPIDRFGKPVWRHDLFNMVGDSFKRVIPAGGSDIVPYELNIPGWVKNPLTISATVNYRKFNLQYARWALDDAHPDLPVVEMAGKSISLAVKIKPEVEAP